MIYKKLIALIIFTLLTLSLYGENGANDIFVELAGENTVFRVDGELFSFDLKQRQRLPGRLVRLLAGNSSLFLVSPAQFRSCFRTTVDGVEYFFIYSDGETEAVYSVDKVFKSANGLKVGDRYIIESKEVLSHPHWRTFGIKGDDGWYPILDVKGESKNAKGEPLLETIIVAFVKFLIPAEG